MRTLARDCTYSFPETVIEAGRRENIRIDLNPGIVFKIQKLILSAQMDVIRGHYKIKRSRLPLLDRDDIVAYSKIHRWSNGSGFRPGKTVIEFSGGNRKNLMRSYLPSSVAYAHVDPLSYIELSDLACDCKSIMPNGFGGISARFFSSDALGNGILAPTTNLFVTLSLKNVSDISVRVCGAICGVQLS